MSNAPTMPRALIIDIETSPGMADIWKLWDINVSLNQLREVTRVICFAAKWHGKPGVQFYSEHHDGRKEMIEAAHRLIEEADIVVHYNGNSFDMPHLHREFLLAGLNPPAPYKNVDLMRVVKRQFRFMSNKLDHVSQQLEIGHKTHHSGHQLWVDCLLGDEKAWSKMKTYNRQDVVLTDQLYSRLLPWIGNHPNVNLYTGLEGCPKCGGTNLQRRGVQRTTVSTFQRWQCTDCGGWSRTGRKEDGADQRSITT